MSRNVVDLFAGAGGLSLGFRQAGTKLLAAVEVSKHHTESYRQNLGDVKIHQEDIQDVYAESFMGVADIVIGAPPYEAFLATNKDRRKEPRDRLYEDPHGTHVLDFVDFLAAARPKAFVLELPPDFAEDELMEALGAEFGKAGYDQVFVNFLNAADYGAATDRVSLFLANVPIEPQPPEDPGPPVGALVESMREGVTNHDIEPLPEERVALLEKLKRGDSLESIPLSGSDEAYPNWFRLIPEATAPPLYGFSRFVHPFEPRLITVREAARIMGFPDNFVFTGNHTQQYEGVGNAVPPPLARYVAMEVLAAIGPGSVAQAVPVARAPRDRAA